MEDRETSESVLTYLTTTRYKSRCICGDVDLAAGTVCQSNGNYICYDGKPICAVTSQDAYDYFARDDDGNGVKRGKMIKQIQTTLRKHPEKWERVWGHLSFWKFKRAEYNDYWLWNYEFYNADMKDLNEIYGVITRSAA